MTKGSIFIFSYPLPLNGVALGRLVRLIRDPTQDYFDPTKQLPSNPKAPTLPSEMNDVSKLLKSSNGLGIELALTSFAQIFLKGENKHARHLEAKQGSQYLLDNADDWFRTICQHDSTRIWLERAAMRGRKAYLVPGLQTLRDVDFEHEKELHIENGLGFEAPVLTAAGVPLPTVLDPAAKLEYLVERGTTQKIDIPDEKVYAVQYREVRLRKGTSSSSPSYDLTSKILWEQIYSDRDASAEDMDEDEEETVEAGLLGAFEDPQDGAIASAIVDGEMYFFEPKK